MPRSNPRILAKFAFLPHHYITKPLLRRGLSSSLSTPILRTSRTRRSTPTCPSSLQEQLAVQSSSRSYKALTSRPKVYLSCCAGARPFSQASSKQHVSRYRQLDVPSSAASGNPLLLQSSSATWVIFTVIGIISGAFIYAVSPTDSLRLTAQESRPEKPAEESELYEIGTPHIMTGESLPGRPGTLTDHQEEKLREFWVATLQVFGVDVKEVDGNGEAEPTPGIVRADTKKSKKKSRMTLFRSSKAKDGDGSEASSIASSPAAEDKYGQTAEFQEALANMSPETLRMTFWSMVKHDNPDALLLRFLRARKWDVEKALVMMVSTMRWRMNDQHVDDDIIKNGELGCLEDSTSSDPEKKKNGQGFLEQMRMGKSFIHGLDKNERPICHVRTRLHKQGEQSEASLERYTVYLIETCRMVLSPPVDTACIVFDMTGFSMANMDYAPVKFMIKCFEANYPECLGVVLVHKAPWVFQGVWKMIKGWLDPVVASKVHFTNSTEDMEVYIPNSHIIAELQGGEDWAYKYIEPVPGENDKMKDTETREKLLKERQGVVAEYEKTTIEWIHGANPDIKIKRDQIANQLRDGYWSLDPYLRARSYYDRMGLLNPGGKLAFYPEKANPSADVTNGIKMVSKLADEKHTLDDID